MSATSLSAYYMYSQTGHKKVYFGNSKVQNASHWNSFMWNWCCTSRFTTKHVHIISSVPQPLRNILCFTLFFNTQFLICNCIGYAGKTLVQKETIIPVGNKSYLACSHFKKFIVYVCRWNRCSKWAFSFGCLLRNGRFRRCSSRRKLNCLSNLFFHCSLFL